MRSSLSLSPRILLIAFVVMASGVSAGSEYLRRVAEDLPAVGLRVADATYQDSCPMLSNDISVDVQDRIATVTFSQVFRNTAEDVTLEPIYLFPVMPEMAVTSMVAITPRGEYHGVVKNTQAAQAEYDAAVKRGDGAYMAQYDADQLDVMKLKVGNLLPGESVRMNVSMVVMLDVALGQWIFELPLAYIRPYVGKSDWSIAEVLWHPQVARVPYTWSLIATAKTSDGAHIINIQSESYALDLIRLEDQTKLQAKLHCNEQPNQFVQLRIFKDHSLSSGVQLSAMWDEHTTDRGIHAWITPSALSRQYDDAEDNDDSDGDGKGHDEYVFILDRSGSMAGLSMQVAKTAVLKSLALLPSEATFNVISFGSRFTPLFAEGARLATREEVDAAARQVSSFDADMGGTEIASPLQHTFSRSLSNGRRRNVFLVTDGQVGNELAVVSLIEANAASNRMFTFGIGNGVSPLIIVEGARAGGGQHYLLPNAGTYLSEAMFDSMTHSRGRSWTVEAMEIDVDGRATTPLSKQRLGTSFDGEVLSVTGIAQAGIDVCAESNPVIVLRVKDMSTQVVHTVRLPTSCSHHKTVSRALTQLAAKQILMEMEHLTLGHRRTELQRERMIQVSTKYQVLCSVTSLIAVEDRSDFIALRRGPSVPVLVPTPLAKTGAYPDSASPVAMTILLVLVLIMMVIF